MRARCGRRKRCERKRRTQAGTGGEERGRKAARPTMPAEPGANGARARADPPRPRAHRDRPPKPSGAGQGARSAGVVGRRGAREGGEESERGEARRPRDGRLQGGQLPAQDAPSKRTNDNDRTKRRAGGARTGGRGKRPRWHPASTIHKAEFGFLNLKFSTLRMLHLEIYSGVTSTAKGHDSHMRTLNNYSQC